MALTMVQGVFQHQEKYYFFHRNLYVFMLSNDHRQTAVDSDYRLKVEYETKVHHKG